MLLSCRNLHAYALAAQLKCCSAQIAELANELADTRQKLESTLRLYEAEAAVAGQAAEHSQRDGERLVRLEGRLADAQALAEAAEQAKDVMQRQLHEAQVPYLA